MGYSNTALQELQNDPPFKVNFEKVEIPHTRFKYGSTEHTYVYKLYGVYIRTRKSHLQS